MIETVAMIVLTVVASVSMFFNLTFAKRLTLYKNAYEFEKGKSDQFFKAYTDTLEAFTKLASKWVVSNIKKEYNIKDEYDI